MSDVFQPYAQALIRFTPRIYGKRLKPLQIGHLAALECVGNPLAVGGVAETADILQAVWLCSMPAHKALAAIDDARTERKLFWFASLNKTHDHAEARAEMLAYWGYYVTSPKRWKDGKTHELRAPVSWLMFWRLAGKRLPADKEARAIWNTPVNEACCWIAVGHATEGDDSLVSEDEAEVIEELDNV